MKSFIAALRNLTLPFGATSGRRIVLDADNGKISLYDSGGSLAAEIGPTFNPEVGFTSYNYTFPYTVQSMLSGGDVSFQAVGSNQWSFPNVGVVFGGIPISSQELALSSGAPDSATAPARINLVSVQGQDPYIDLSSSGASGPVMDFRIDGISNGRGLLGSNVVTAPSAQTNGTPITVQTVNNPARIMRAGRAFRISLYGLVNSTVGGDWVGVNIQGNSGRMLVDAQMGYPIPLANTNTPVTLQKVVVNNTTTDQAVFLTANIGRSTGTGLVRWAADATSPGILMVEEIGLATDYPGARSVI